MIQISMLDIVRPDQRAGIKLQLLRGLQETRQPPTGPLRPLPPDSREEVFAWLCALIGIVILLAAIFWL